MTWPAITLLRPGWLLVLPVLAALGWWLHRRGDGLGGWTRAADPALLQAMTALGRVDAAGRGGTWVAALVAAGLAALALAGPAVERRDTLSYRNLDGVLLVIDASASATEHADWAAAMALARVAVGSLRTRPGGLIVFAGDAYVATDLTRDHLQLGQTVSLIDAGTVPDPGSRPARALDLAAEVLAAAQVLAGDVILFTDGAGLGPESLAAASAIAARNARLSVVAMGEAGPAAATHAALGQGRVLALSDSDALRDWLTESARTRLEQQDYPLLFWADLGRWVLLAALAPMLLLFRRRSA